MLPRLLAPLALLLACGDAPTGDGDASSTAPATTTGTTADPPTTSESPTSESPTSESPTTGATTGAPQASPCTSVERPIHESKLPDGDPCRLPGAEAVGPDAPTPPPLDGPLDPLARGPHSVGVTTRILQSAGRDILVEVWYPASSDIVGQPHDAYTYAEDAPPDAIDQLEAACFKLDPLDAGGVRDAPPIDDGRFPLVVFSHGTTSTRVQSVSVTSHLASHGFVVAAPDHTGDTLVEFFAAEGQQNPLEDPAVALQLAGDRVADVTAILDHLLAENDAPDACFTGRIDPDAIGVFGHSFGGFTALAASGGALVGPPADARVKAVLPVAPGGTSFTAASDDPLLAMGGDADVTTPFADETQPAYDRVTGDRWLIKLLGAGHLTVSDMCLLKLQEQIDLFGFAPCNVCEIVEAGCPGGEAKMLTTRAAMQYFTAAFFLAVLTSGERAAEARVLLDPAGPGPAQFPAVWSEVEVTVDP